MNNNSTPNVEMGFAESWYYNSYGFRFGEEYFSDPLARNAQHQEMPRRLHERFMGLGLGSAEPQPYLGVGVQPATFIVCLFGADLQFADGQSVWSVSHPLEHVQSEADLNDVAIPDLDDHWLVKEYLRQYRILCDAFPDHAAEGKISLGGMDGFSATQTTLTTAVELFGIGILEMIAGDPDLAVKLFDWVTRINMKVIEYLACKRGDTITKIQLGDCSATMMSPQLYRQFGLRYNCAYVKRFGGACRIHNCGNVTQLLDQYGRLPGLEMLELGWGTDIAKARLLYPDMHIVARLGPAWLMNADSDEIKETVKDMINAAGSGPLTIRCIGIEHGTADESIHAVYEAAQASRSKICGKLLPIIKQTM